MAEKLFPLPAIDLGGGVRIEDPVILAPMSGVTDLPFRRLARSFGADLVISEMIASKAMIHDNPATQRMALSAGRGGVNAVQLTGCDSDDLAEAAKRAEALGAQVVDINFGCPARKVAVGQAAGSALMRDETRAAHMLEQVVKAVKVPVTLKMRMGWDHENLNAPSLARIAQECGIRMLTVHGRTRQQFYRGQADWGFVRRVREACTLPLIVNGDVTSAATARRALELSGADGVMVGRGCYGRPWFPARLAQALRCGGEVETMPLVEEKGLALQHYQAMVAHYGPVSGPRVARKHICWYSAGLRDSALFRSTVNRMEDGAEVLAFIANFYDRLIESDWQRSLPESNSVATQL
ncbi:tRNA dihydrouridine synthase DusB [Formicincola oecophyllae]|uniref:tRNA-dihydrouridine synthase n=1 Tax=Formicincola oecophyllae TaxID=2558361 RepID=A0A4Y6UB17_9PROT|nr:tRNA dihydrouridine synthase DusB [Formicincola oecophyllae]QDH13656.1 tRNA dihydrouridine synthase DusB [Formicincola oecophyllae]